MRPKPEEIERIRAEVACWKSGAYPPWITAICCVDTLIAEIDRLRSDQDRTRTVFAKVVNDITKACDYFLRTLQDIQQRVDRELTDAGEGT
jgi:hypothetical protein